MSEKLLHRVFTGAPIPQSSWSCCFAKNRPQEFFNSEFYILTYGVTVVASFTCLSLSFLLCKMGVMIWILPHIGFVWIKADNA